MSILYRTHKSLSPASKIHSLYTFDALARAARSYTTKHSQTGDLNTEPGNCATFLLKVEGVLDGLFRDMLRTDHPDAKVSPIPLGNTDRVSWTRLGTRRSTRVHPLGLRVDARDMRLSSHNDRAARSSMCAVLDVTPDLCASRTPQSASCHMIARPCCTFSVHSHVNNSNNVVPFLLLQEKTKKVLDIWVKGHTFPSDVMSRLQKLFTEAVKGAYRIPTLFAKYSSIYVIPLVSPVECPRVRCKLKHDLVCVRAHQRTFAFEYGYRRPAPRGCTNDITATGNGASRFHNAPRSLAVVRSSRAIAAVCDAQSGRCCHRKWVSARAVVTVPFAHTRPAKHQQTLPPVQLPLPPPPRPSWIRDNWPSFSS